MTGPSTHQDSPVPKAAIKAAEKIRDQAFLDWDRGEVSDEVEENGWLLSALEAAFPHMLRALLADEAIRAAEKGWNQALAKQPGSYPLRAALEAAITTATGGDDE